MPRTARTRWVLLALVLGAASSPRALLAAPIYKFIDLGLSVPEEHKPWVTPPPGWVEPAIVDGPEPGSKYLADANGEIASPFNLGTLERQALDYDDPAVRALLEIPRIDVPNFRPNSSDVNSSGRALISGSGFYTLVDGEKRWGQTLPGRPYTIEFVNGLLDQESNSYVDLKLLASQNGWSWASFSRIDEEGRIFGWGAKDGGGNTYRDGWMQDYHAFLMLPMGMPAPVPEPSSALVFAALAAGGGLLARRPRSGS